MQFTRHGPDVPERLLQAHEDGRVVFFCGAGISYPAGLPGFKGLVEQIYQEFYGASDRKPVQQLAINASQFDTAIGLLEADLVNGQEKVRGKLAEILTPDLAAPNATATHQALLTLAKNRQGRTQLITTNFDRLFEEVKASQALSFPTFPAPLLPPGTGWDGLVYLHGLLPAHPTLHDLKQLVVSSGDFGRAYLLDGWAARFIGRVFRDSTVCFVGYSIDDSVLRYMVDALAADRLQGESSPEMFAFGGYDVGESAEKASNEWKKKNVTPIIYDASSNHVHLHETLHAWAGIYADGVRGKERIVDEHASADPKTDPYAVNRMRWALSDPSGLPAKRFAEHNPVPSLAWLEPLNEPVYGEADLERFGVSPAKAAKGSAPIQYSLLDRPTPYALAPNMALVDDGPRRSRWDEVMGHLADWLTRHLHDPKLLHWLLMRGIPLHERWVARIQRRLKELDDSKRIHCGLGELDLKDSVYLNRIRANVLSIIPHPAMRTLWRLWLSGHVKFQSVKNDRLSRWFDQFEYDGLTASLRLALREALRPCIHLDSPYLSTNYEESAHIRSLVHWDMALASDDVEYFLKDCSQDAQWTAALPELLDDFSALLRDALDLMQELGEADGKSDLSCLHQPSIAAHEQNEKFDIWGRHWTVLI